MQKFIKTMFSITVFADIVLIAAGAASLIRTIVSMASGEQAQPGALGIKGNRNGNHQLRAYHNDILLGIYKPEWIKKYSTIHCIDIGDGKVDLMTLKNGIEKFFCVFQLVQLIHWKEVLR